VFGGIGALITSGIFGSSGAGASTAVFGLMSMMGFGIALFYPVMLVLGALISPWIYGGIHHLTLALFGGVTKSYTHTVRVVGYSHAAYFWCVIPIIGPFAALILTVISLVVGLDETHKCGVGKALGAVLLIPGICCMCWCGFNFFAGFNAGLRP
jgi:hypothetical protein